MNGDQTNTKRRKVLSAVTSAVGAVGAVGVAVPFVGSWQPSERAKVAGAPVSVDLSTLAPGKMLTVEWRGKPIYIIRRTQAALDALTTIEPLLRDPGSNESKQPSYVSARHRAQNKHFIILIGLCTHLGCAPAYQPHTESLQSQPSAAAEPSGEWQSGFFCQCHGSKFDLAGRVLLGAPAPVNLEVPPHHYVSDSLVIIGQDQGDQQSEQERSVTS